MYFWTSGKLWLSPGKLSKYRPHNLSLLIYLEIDQVRTQRTKSDVIARKGFLSVQSVRYLTSEISNGRLGLPQGAVNYWLNRTGSLKLALCLLKDRHPSAATAAIIKGHHQLSFSVSFLVSSKLMYWWGPLCILGLIQRIVWLLEGSVSPHRGG